MAVLQHNFSPHLICSSDFSQAQRVDHQTSSYHSFQREGFLEKWFNQRLFARHFLQGEYIGAYDSITGVRAHC